MRKLLLCLLLLVTVFMTSCTPYAAIPLTMDESFEPKAAGGMDV